MRVCVTKLLINPIIRTRTRHFVTRTSYTGQYHTKIWWGGFNAKVRREDIFKPTIGNENLNRISNDNGIRVVNFAISKHPIVKSTKFQHCNIHKFTWTSPDGKTRNQIDYTVFV
jgi:hypothetical protein